jgi:hypothetical protein
MKHPAPWRMKSFPAGSEVMVDANGERVSARISEMVDANGREVSDIGWSETDRLILAAPELLAALKECHNIIRALTFDGDKVDAAQAHERNEALIARIEGTP